MLRRLGAGNRAKRTDVVSATLFGQTQDLVAEFGAQHNQRQHISIRLQFPACRHVPATPMCSKIQV